uniref:Uncharacterized protein n=1 Tax=Acrobeloides nanus TaxID=290746 RepID=A0A914CRL5_9BILA
MFFYLLIGAIVFVRIEKPVETIEMDAYLEFRQEWSKRLLKNGFTVLKVPTGHKKTTQDVVLNPKNQMISLKDLA